MGQKAAYSEKMKNALASVAQLVGALSCILKGCGFDSWLGHRPRLWVLFLVRAHIGDN